MYDRATRSLNATIGCTPDHVGPGTYEHPSKKFAEVSYAPFLSLANRGDLFANDDNPGPGQYDLRTDRSLTIKGGSSLANKASRFDQKLPEITPGPGTYEFHGSQSARAAVPDLIKHQRQNIFRFNRKSLPPSIPDPRFAYGFEENDIGKLVPQFPPNRDESIGPASYNTSTVMENDSTKFYQGVHFSKYSSKRTDFSGKTGPGPGEYDPNDLVKLEVHHVHLKSWEKRPELQVARYPENVLKIAAKDNVPGPGQYSIKRDLDPGPSKLEITGMEFERPGFGSQTTRFDTHPPEIPGPTTYNDKLLTAFNASQTKPTSFKRTPFNQTSKRFHPIDYKSRSEPGPGQYRISSFAEDNFRRAVIDGGKKPPFNVTATRRLDITKKDDYNTPGPNSYDVKTESFKPKTSQPSANFLSQTVRDPIIEDTPAPNAYDVPRAYQALVSQTRQPPRSKHARQRHSQFLSASKRIFAGDTSSDTPGPAAYDGLPTTHAHGYAPLFDSRFRKETSIMPGPADYELSPLLQDTVLRGTFNAKLNNPILEKLQSRALRDEKAFAIRSLSPVIVPDVNAPISETKALSTSSK